MTPTTTIDMHLDPAAFDDPSFPLGIVRTALDHSVVYTNRRFDDLLGRRLPPGANVLDLNLDEASRARLQQELAARAVQRHGSSYHLRVLRPDLGTQVQVQVAAVPAYDSHGSMIGSLGFVSDHSLDTCASAIHLAMKDATQSQPLLEAMAQQLRLTLSFDAVMVSALSRDAGHLRSLFEWPEASEGAPRHRWWAMPPFVRAMTQEFKPGPLDLQELFERPDFAAFARTDESLRRFKERRLRHALRLRVDSRGANVAVLTLLRRDGGEPFTERDLALCEYLPLVETLRWALSLDEQDKQRATLDLCDELASMADDAPAARQRLVDALHERYGWEHVSLFKAMPHEGRLRLVCQAAAAPVKLPDDYEQSASSGLMGRALGSQDPVNAPRATDDPDYQPAGAGMRSSLVLRLPRRQTTWLLNIESAQESAFATEEREDLEKVLRVADLVIDRSAVLGLQSAILDHMADVVIHTNEINTILDINRAGVQLFGQPREAMVGRLLTSFIELGDDREDGGDNDEWGVPMTIASEAGPDATRALLYAADRCAGVMLFRASEDRTVRMLVSSSPLAGEFSGKVFVASDLTVKDYSDRVASLAPRLRQVASEIRVPLALASHFLDEADEGSEGGDPLEMIGMALAQIRKADVSIERVMRLAAATEDRPLALSTFELRTVVSSIEQELPRDHHQLLRLMVRGDNVMVNAAFAELRHCVQSLLARLLVLRRGSEQIEMKIGVTFEGRPFLTMRLNEPQPATEPRVLEDEELQRDIEPMARGLLARMGGVLQGNATALRYRIVLRKLE